MSERNGIAFRFAILLVCCSGFLRATPTIGTVQVSQTQIPVNTPTTITVTASITDPTFIPGGANVQRIGTTGQVTVLGILYDDGTHGDVRAGDHVFTAPITLTEPMPGVIHLRVSAAFLGELRRVFADPVTLVVTGPGCSDGSCKTGTGWGDVHFITFDQLAYDFQAVGEFVLARSTQDDLEVQIRTKPWRNSRVVSVTSAVAARVAGDRIGLYVDGGTKLYINGTQTSIASSIRLPNGGSITWNGSQMDVVWPDLSSVRLFPRSSYLDLRVQLAQARTGYVRGLLGNADGDNRNDLASRDETAFVSPLTFDEFHKQYGESWRINQPESLFDYDSGKNTGTYTDRTFPGALVNLTDTVRAQAEQACRARGIADPILLAACIIDVGTTAEAAFADSSAAIPAPPSGVMLPGLLPTGFFDGFETNAANTFPVNWYYSGNSDIHVDGSRSASGSQSVYVNGVSGGCWEALIHRPLNITPSSEYSVAGTVYTRPWVSGGCHGWRAWIGQHMGPSWTTGNRGFLVFWNDGTMRGGGGLALGTYTPGTWTKFKISYEHPDASTIKLSYWIDDVFKGSETLSRPSNESQFVYYTLSSGDGPVWYDDVKVK